MSLYSRTPPDPNHSTDNILHYVDRTRDQELSIPEVRVDAHLEINQEHQAFDLINQSYEYNNAMRDILFSPIISCHEQQWGTAYEPLPLETSIQNTELNYLPISHATTQPETQYVQGKDEGLRKRRRTSVHRGVSYYKRTRKWVAQLRYKGVRRHLGYFDTEMEASRAYRRERYRMKQRFDSTSKCAP